MGIGNGKWINNEPMLENGEHDCRPLLPWMTRFVRPGAVWECKCGIRWVARMIDGGKKWQRVERPELNRDAVLNMLERRQRGRNAVSSGHIGWVLDELAELNLAKWET